METILKIPDPSLVMLIGASGSGKSTFARRRFRTTEVLSSDFCRALISDDEADQSATADAFELLRMILNKRLERKRLTVVDATNVQAMARQAILEAAIRWNVPAVAIVFALPEAVCQARNLQRVHRQVPPAVIQQQTANLAASYGGLNREGFASIYCVQSVEEAERLAIAREVSRLR